MPAYQNGTQHEIWLARDDGTRLKVIDLAGYFSFTRALNNVGYFSIVLPVGFDKRLLANDRRIYFWRRPVGGALHIAFEGFIRNIITSSDRDGNTVRIIQGYDLNYLLSGRYCAYPEENANVDTTVTPVEADDLLKEIVRTNLGSTATTGNGRKASGVINDDYFGVDFSVTLGPLIAMAFSYRNVLDVCREICDASRADGTDLYFEIQPKDEDGSGHSMEFRTFIGQLGKDRTADSAGGGLTFGLDFGNMAEPELVEDATDEVNRVYGTGRGEGAARSISLSDDATRQAASIFALREGVAGATSQRGSLEGEATVSGSNLTAGRPKTTLTCKLQSVVERRCVYGLDWDFGDRVTVTYDNRQGDALVRSVTVTVDENSVETIDAQVETYLT